MKIMGPVTIDSFLTSFKEFLGRERTSYQQTSALLDRKAATPVGERMTVNMEIAAKLVELRELLEERQVFEALADGLMDRPFESRCLSEQEARDIVEEAAAACL